MSNNSKHSTSSTIQFKVDSKTYIMREKEWKMLKIWEVDGYLGPYPFDKLKVDGYQGPKPPVN